MKAKGIWIPGNVPSSKNSKMMVFRGKKEGEKPLLLDSKPTTNYRQNSKTKLGWLEGKKDFLHLTEGSSFPIVVGFHFYRKSRRKYDWVNMVQICQDLMVEYGWIEDDNTDFMLPVPFKMNGQYSTYNKDNPGVWIVPVTQQVLNDLKRNINE